MKQKLLWICLLPVLLFTLSVPVHSEIENEYFVKSILFQRFSNYVTWPKSTGIKNKSKPFIIAVIGENPFGQILKRVYTGKRIRDKNVTIRFLTDIGEIENCHILFISSSLAHQLPAILKATKDKPILTVGDTPGFAKKGVIINMYQAGTVIRFEISTEAVRNAKIDISTKLIKISRIVESTENNS
ncbi:MAG: YfiR family protein [bacterium]|nr:YfiR family protein [bacterium]